MAVRPDTLELALVDKDLLLKLLRQPQPPTPLIPPVNADLKQMVITGQNMDNVLKSQTMTPRSQRDAYSELLAVKNLHGKRYADEGFSNKDIATGSPLGGREVVEKSNGGVIGASELTPLQAVRAKMLLKHLAMQDPDKISWDDEGNLAIYGRPLPGVTISNVVTQLSRNRTGDETAPEFVRLLPELDIPATLIQNRKVQASRSGALDRGRDAKGRYSKSLSPSTPPKSPYPGKWEKLNP